MFFPAATYRVQLNTSYTFKDLKKIIPYLDKLGVSTLYASPITKATKGSTHGYDVTDPHQINPEIGTQEEFEDLVSLCKQHGMTWLQDIVPNHMAFVTENERLMDVFERGSKSPYYTYFDINWNHFNPLLKGKVMIPFLGSELEQCVENNEIEIEWSEQGLMFVYFDNKYPVATDSYPSIFKINTGKDFLDKKLLQKTDELVEKSATLELVEWKVFSASWVKEISDNKEIKQIIERALETINKDKELLKQLLRKQHHLLTYWKVTESEINYRRFFTVNTLICLRMEDEAVFREYHTLIQRLYQEGLIQGLRIDHIDGLYDAKQYVERLRNLLGDECYVIAEKILEYNEHIAEDWPLQGTSGYEFLSFTNQLLTDKNGGAQLLDYYKELLPESKKYDEQVYENKLNFLYSQMGGELDNLVHYVEELQLLNKGQDKDNVKKALAVFMASFPVYRIYPDGFPLNDESHEFVTEAFKRAGEKGNGVAQELKWLQAIFETGKDDASSKNKLLFLMRLMQFTGPLAAKGVEDTTFYVYNPMISHNEVGDAPSNLGITVEEFHNKMVRRQQQNPYSLNTTSTHDTKRGEDARMRLNVISELVGEWKQLVSEWQNVNKQFIRQVDGKAAPSINDEYFIYQSLVGGFPETLELDDIFFERAHLFIGKALREAKVNTTYTEPNTAYEEACKQFISSILQKEHGFLKTFVPFIEKIIQYASIYSSIQTLIKITAPGIPDVYQGCELWDISFVDPDNRRPVDYTKRIEMLDSIIEKEKQGVEAVLSFISEQRKQGAEKLFVTAKALNFRRNNNSLFLNGNYIPLQIDNRNDVVAYGRMDGSKWVLVIVPVGLVEKATNGNFSGTGNWKNVSIKLPSDAPQKWKNEFTGEIIESNGTLQVSDLFRKFPLALLSGSL